MTEWETLLSAVGCWRGIVRGTNPEIWIEDQMHQEKLFRFVEGRRRMKDTAKMKWMAVGSRNQASLKK
jgi:hypothetical protein